MAEPPPKLRITALLSAGTLVVHELRYRLAFGGDAHSALAVSGHGYLGVVTPAIAMLAFLAVASLVQRLGGSRASRSVRRRWIWLALAGSLLMVFCLQEVLEGVLSSGHPDGIDGVFGHGGWLAAPLSMAVAAVALAFVRLAEARPLAGIATRLIRWPSSAARAFRLRSGRVLGSRPLARNLAGRAPPVLG